MGYIYKITHIDSNKAYIGQTINNPEIRWKQHLKKNNSCVYLKNAIDKYGKQSFKFEIICISFDSELNKLENEYILKYNTLIPNGYNISLGGNNKKHHEETKIKISKSLQKFWSEHEHPKPQLGKPHTNETKDKIRLKNIGKTLSETTKIKISISKSKYFVIKIKDGIEIEKYKNIKEASEKNNVSKAAISKACNNKIKILKGCEWKYENYN